MQGSFKNAFYTYTTKATDQCCRKYHDWAKDIVVLSEKSPLQQPMPLCGGYLAFTSRDKRLLQEPAGVIAQGVQNNIEIRSTHMGEKIAGEYLRIYHEDDPEKRHSAYKFDEVKHILKDDTLDYVTMWAVDEKGDYHFLANYLPDDECPQYTKCLFMNNCCSDHGCLDLCIKLSLIHI